MTDQIIQDIIDSIDGAISEFQKKIPGIQTRVFDELQNYVQQLATKDGKILANTENLKLIANIKNKIGRILVDKDYTSAVKKFIQAYETVATLQNSYFSAINAAYTPKRTLDIIKTISVDATLNSLLDSGITSNVIDKMGDVLRNNITGGGSFATLSNQLRDHIMTNESGQGSLERYVTQITTDALNQYSAQYQQAVAADLGFNWGRYVGSNLKTTREFCEYLTKKEWVHRSELPAIIEGDIDGHHCKVGKNGLPLGMIPGTNDNNFQVFRGGYNCGHQFFYVPDSAVPKNILERFQLKNTVFPGTNKISEYTEVKKNYTGATIGTLKDKFSLSPSQVAMITAGIPTNDPSSVEHTIGINGSQIQSIMRSKDFEIQRSIYPLEKRIYNALFEVKSTGDGIGLSGFTNQVISAKSLGFEKITVSAAKSDKYNGYYTWARFGYSMKPEEQSKFGQLMNQNGRKELDLLDLMQTKEGQDFWKKNGFWFEGEFDLKDGSKNIAALQRYLNEKKIEFKL